MYFRSRRLTTLGAIGKDDAGTGVPQRGRPQPIIVTPAQRQEDAARVESARQEIAAQLVPVTQNPQGETIYGAQGIQNLPPGADTLGIRADGTILFRYPTEVNRNSIITPVPISAPSPPLPQAPSPTPSPDVVPLPNPNPGVNAPPSPAPGTGQDLSPGGNPVVTPPSNTLEDILAWLRGQPAPNISVNVPGAPPPATAGSDAIEVIEEGGIPLPLLLLLGAGAYFLFFRKGRSRR